MIILIIIIVILYAIHVYNLLIKKRIDVKEAWHQIDVQLKRRCDLIPNLVETVKGYASHEREVFEKVSEARARAMGAKSVKESAEANNILTQTLKTLFAIAEAYPDLKANQNFLQLQNELIATENQIATIRQSYNNVVKSYNITCETFPRNIVAKIFNFKLAEFYTIPEEEKEAPKVSFKY